MAQLERYPRHVKTSKSLTTPSVDKFLRVSHESYTFKGSPTSSPSAISPSSPYYERSKFHDPEDNQKKSVLAKVKEKAKKLRISLSKKKHEDGIVTPTSCAAIEEEEEEEEEEDAEYLGAPMYESEFAPQSYKENARQHPRASPVIAENHLLRNPFKSRSVETDGETETPKALNMTAEQNRITQLAASSKTMNFAPARTKSSDSALSVPSKIPNLTISNLSEFQAPSSAPALSRRSHLSVTGPQSPPAKTGSRTSPVGSKSPRFSPSAPSTPRRTSSSTATMMSVKSTNNSRDQTSEKGVSAKEFIDKLEAGEDDENAVSQASQVSQVISEAMNPNRTPGDVAVIEKVREAVTSLLRNDEPTQQYAVKTTITRTSSQNPGYTNVQVQEQEVAQEESHGRVLQAN